MLAHRPLLTAALLVAGVALAQTSGGTPGSTPGSNPPPDMPSSMTTRPGLSGTGANPEANKGGEALAPPVSSALGTTPTPEAILANLHMANRSEIDLGKVAEQRAQNKEVKKFGKHMVKAHTEMDKEAQAWAKKHHLAFGAPPQDESRQAEVQKTQETKQRLEALSGSEFDKAYMQAMSDDHAKDLQEVTTFEEQTTNKDLKKFLGGVKKEIASHKRDADKILQKLGATAAR